MSTSTTPPLALQLIEKAIADKATSLDLGCCGLTEIPEEVLAMDWLEELSISNYYWHTDKDELVKSKNTGPLNYLTTIPNLSKLKKLKILRASGIDNTFENYWGIHIIPEKYLPESLFELYLSYNQLTEIKGLDQLTGLNSLDLRSNQLTEIKGLDQLTGLNSLDLRSNQLTEIKGLDQLTGLNSLDLSSNQLTEIKGLDQLTGLQELRLSDNGFSFIARLKTLSSITELNLFNNPLKDVPQELLGESYDSNCLPDIQNWWNEMDSSTNTVLNTLTKLQVTGNGDVGKSSLIEALKKGTCHRKIKSTHGVLIEPLEFDTAGGKIQFQAWDFGGQEIYHSTHRLFIAAESVQIIVTDTISEQDACSDKWVPDRVNKKELIQLQPLERFVDICKNQSPQSPIIIIQNKADDGKRDAGIYLEAAKKELDFLQVSAENGYGIDELRLKLANHAKKLLQYGMPMPKSWISVRQFFINNLRLTAKKRKKIITQDEFEVLCRDNKVLEKAIPSLKKFLHHTGLIYYNKDLLKDKIIADQRWALDAIYKPLDRYSRFYDQMRNVYKGIVRAKEVLNAFGNKYAVSEKWLFLQFMQSCGICFSLKEQNIPAEEKYYIFPEFLPEKETTVTRQLWNKANDVVHYRYNLNYSHKSDIQQFIVAAGNKAPLEYIWKYGILVPTDKGLIRVEADLENVGIVISIEKSALEYLKWVISTFRFDTGSEKKWIVGNDPLGKETLNVETIQNLHVSKKRETVITNKQASRTEYEGETREESVLQNDAPSDIPPQRPKRVVVSYASEDREVVTLLSDHLDDYKGGIQLLYDFKEIDGTIEWDQVIKEMFQNADGFIILVSKYYQKKNKKEYIWEKEIPIIEKKFYERKTFTYCITVSPVNYDYRLSKFPVFRAADECIPTKGHARDKFIVDFAREIIKEKFLKLK